MTDYQRIELTDIDLRALTPCKITLHGFGAQDHSRWVLRGGQAGRPGALYYKIWNPSYVCRDNILAAIAAGFYDERTVPALQALVFHEGICRGYVMSEGELRPDACDEDFRALVYERTRETGYFFVQFGRNHTMIHRGKRSLLDIESVYPLAALPRLADYRSHMDDGDYARFVAGLHGPMPDPGDLAMPPARGAAHRFLLLRWRSLMRALRNRAPRLDLIQL